MFYASEKPSRATKDLRIANKNYGNYGEITALLLRKHDGSKVKIRNSNSNITEIEKTIMANNYICNIKINYFLLFCDAIAINMKYKIKQYNSVNIQFPLVSISTC